MTREAMDKIRDEMAGKADDPMVQRIGDFLTGYLRANPEAAGRLMAEGKSIEGARDALVARARKMPQRNSCVVMEGEVACAMVLEYYGLTGGKAAVATRTVAVARVSDALDLDALLGL